VCSLPPWPAQRTIHTFGCNDELLRLFIDGISFSQAQSRIQELENLARTKVSLDFHKRTVERLEQQIKAASGEKTQGAAEVKRLTDELKEVNTKMEEAIKAVGACF
jgi:chromosome segregation ATPase